MSSGRKFSQVTVLSTEDHLEELERKYDVIRDRIQVYDDLIRKFEALKTAQEEYSKKPQELENKIKDLEAKNKETFFKNQITIDRHSDQYNFIFRKIGELEDAVDRSAVSFNSSKEDLYKKIKDTEEKSISHSLKKLDNVEFDKFKSFNASQMNDLQEQARIRMVQFDAYEKGIEALVDSIHDANDLLRSHGVSITRLNSMVNGINSNISSKITEQAKIQDKNYTAFKEQIAQTLLTMKQEIIGTPSSNEAVEARIINRLEMATMDGSNAVTMARNSDQKIKLLEKKIEALTTQLAKYELK